MQAYMNACIFINLVFICSAYEAMETYIPVSEDEVGFQAQDRIKVVAKSMDGWWKIRSVHNFFKPLLFSTTIAIYSNNDNYIAQ